MTPQHNAVRDATLEVHVTRRKPMTYEEGASAHEDRPPHVRAASGLSRFKEYLVVVQDDANWLAVIDAEDRVHAIPVPAQSDGARVFSATRGNKHEKFDLEACTTVPGENGHELIGFGSGSHRGREWMLRVHDSAAGHAAVLKETVSHDTTGLEVRAEFLDAQPFYDSLRENKAFSGAGLNIEGAITLDDDRLMLFQRGNAPATEDGPPPRDATAELSWRALAAHLAAPAEVPPPALENVRQYDLGSLDGVRLTFSDAEPLPNGSILYSASAEDSETDRIAGSALGIIEPGGEPRWTEIIDVDGTAFGGKVEGLSCDRHDPCHVRFVIDDDDETLPSEIFDAVLSPSFLVR